MSREEKILSAVVRRMYKVPKARSCSHARAISSIDAASRELKKTHYPELAALGDEVEARQKVSGRSSHGGQSKGYWSD